MTVDQPLLKAALLLKERGPSDVFSGICYNIWYNEEGEFHECMRGEHDAFEAAVDNRLYEIFRMWPEYSGEVNYPVPHPKYSPMDAFILEKNVWIGEYGAARRRLLDFIISTLQEATA